MSDEVPNRAPTFSQAQGYEPLPTPLALEEIPDHARIDLWNWLWTWIRSDSLDESFTGDAERALRLAYTEVLHGPLDAFPGSIAMASLAIKPWFTSGKFNKLLDVIEFILRTPMGRSHYDAVRRIFRQNLLAYDILDIPPYGPTIVPNASPEEGQAIQKAFAALVAGPFDGARQHLKQAADFINAGNWPKAVAESMHSVESVVRVISPNSNFGQALSALNAKSAMHPAFRDALSKLYGYTSDEKGIRHPLLESDVSRVQMPEATFMYGACASFITYLIARARETGLLDR